MHAWLPLRKVILRAVSSAWFPTATTGGLQVRVDPRDARFLDGLRQGLEPPLRLPLAGVLAPERLVHVARAQVADDQGALRNDDLADLVAVRAADRLVQGQHHVLAGPDNDIR